MTLLDERPDAAGPDQRDWLPIPAPARRAQWRLAARIAWREVLRRRARSALVIALIAVPTAAMILAAAGYRTSRSIDGHWGDRGTADIVVGTGLAGDGVMQQPPGDDRLAAAGVPSDAAVARHLWAWAPLEPVGYADHPDQVDLVHTQLTDIDRADAERFELVDMVAGEAPEVGQILLSPHAAHALDVQVGDALTLERPSGTWTVSGIGRLSSNYSTGLAWIPGFDPARLVPEARWSETLIDMPPGTSPDELLRIAAAFPDASVTTTAYDDPFAVDDTAGLTLGWLGGAMAFLAFGIVIAAAFATSARGQLVSVGQLAANGAPTRLIVRVLSWQGLWSGLLGGVAGTGLALGLLPAIEGPAEVRWYGRSVDLVVRPLDAVIVVATATVAGLLAALVPTRSLARTTVLSALAGRRPVKPVPHWLLTAGAVFLAGGTGLMALAVLASRNATTISVSFTAAALLGATAVAVGTCCVSPWTVQQLARLAHRLPLAGRLALRGLARSRGRSAAVISAIAVTVGLATAAVGAFERSVDERLAGDRYLPRDTVVLDLVTTRDADTWNTELPAEIELPPVDDAEVPAAALDRLAEILPDAEVLPMRHAVVPAGTIDTRTEMWKTYFRVPIASDTALRAGAWTSAARAEVERAGFVRLAPDDQPYFDEGPRANLVVDAEAPLWGPFSQLMTEEYARQHGFEIVATGVIVRSNEPLSAEQRREVDQLWRVLAPESTRMSAFIEPGDPPTAGNPMSPPVDYWSVFSQHLDPNAEREAWMARGVALTAAVVLVGVIVAIGLALAAADERTDRSVFAAVGARPASIRRMAAWNAVTMTTIGIAIGVPVGFMPTWVVVRAAARNDHGIPFPWLFVVAVVAIVPASMAALAWVTSRFARPPTPNRLAG